MSAIEYSTWYFLLSSKFFIENIVEKNNYFFTRKKFIAKVFNLY